MRRLTELGKSLIVCAVFWLLVIILTYLIIR